MSEGTNATEISTNGQGAPPFVAKKRGQQSLADKTDEALKEAMASGDLTAARKIGKTFIELQELEKHLKEKRKELKAAIEVCAAAFKNAVEEPDDGTEERGRQKLDLMLGCWQDWEDAKAFSKDELSLLLADKKNLHGRLEKQIEGARQLGLFEE
jgi:hypothetical protein